MAETVCAITHRHDYFLLIYYYGEIMQKILPFWIFSCLNFAYAEQENTALLDDIYVTAAYKVPAKYDNTGSSVTILTKEDLVDLNATDVVDALKFVPGLSVYQSGGHGTLSNVFIRGAESDQTMVLIDGIKVNNPGAGGAFDFGTLSLNDIERIEVLRGEQSALWGSDAVGGVISIETTTGKYAEKPFNAKLSIGAGSDVTRDISTTFYGRNDNIYYAINFNRNQTDGISAASENHFTYTDDNGSRIITGGASEDDEFTRNSASLRLGLDFERAGLELLYRHSSFTSHYDNSSLVRNINNNDFDFSAENNGDPKTKTNENLVKLAGFLGNEDDLIYQSAYISAMSYNSIYYSAYDNSYSNADKRNLGYQIDFNFDRVGNSTQAITAFAEYTKDQLDGYNGDNSISQNSAALEYRWFHNEDHAFSAGVRYDDNDYFGNDTTFRIAGGYRLTENFRLHSSFGSATKNPTLTNLYGYGGTYQGSPDLESEKSLGGDIGLLIESTDKAHQLDITYFKRRLKDAISTYSFQDADGNYRTSSYNIDGKSRIHGVELSYHGQLTDSLKFFTNYTYTNTEDEDGNELIRRPKHQASVGFNYQINEQWSAHTNAIYVGSREDSYYDNTTYGQIGVKLPSYTVLNLGASYQINKNAELYLNANNLFNEHYENSIGYGQPERNFYLGFRGSW